MVVSNYLGLDLTRFILKEVEDPRVPLLLPRLLCFVFTKVCELSLVGTHSDDTDSLQLSNVMPCLVECEV